MKGLHRDEAVGGQDRGVKEDQEDQQCRKYVARVHVRRARAVRTHFTRGKLRLF
jgi:hypothetical protein